MASLNSQRLLYALAVVLIPISFGTKEILGLNYCLDPTLILGLLVFLLWPTKPRPMMSIVVPVFAIFSAYAGTFYMPPIYGDLLSLYHIFKEPLRLLLAFFFFWVSVRLFVRDRKYVLRWVSISVLVQFGLAVYLILAILGKLPYPQFLDKYVDAHLQAQWIYVGPYYVPRLCGTFYESPPLGMFMVSALVILAFGRFRDGMKDKVVEWGLAAAAVGTIWSFSEQVLLGLLPLCAGVVLTAKRGKFTFRIAIVAILLLLIPFVGAKLIQKVQQEQELSGQAVVGTSGGERAFHIRYAFRALSENSWGWLTGLGPGRYGEYVSRTGFFPDTVTPQVTPIAWLFGFGIIGTTIIGAWLFRIAKSSVKSYGIFLGLGGFLGIVFADMFQAGWKNESFFLALAYLYSSAYFKRLPKGQPKREKICSNKKIEHVNVLQSHRAFSPGLHIGEIP